MNNPHFLVVSKQVDFYCRIDIDFYSVRAYKKSVSALIIFRIFQATNSKLNSVFHIIRHTILSTVKKLVINICFYSSSTFVIHWHRRL